MKSIEEIISSPVKLSTYKGSKATADILAEKIKAKYGPAELKNYNPNTSMMTYPSWFKLGFKPRKGEKAMRSVTYIDIKNDQGVVIRKQKHDVCLFYYRQMVPLNQK